MRDYRLEGKIVEIHLLNGKRFLGIVRRQDSDGLTLTCIPVQVMETMPEGIEVRSHLKSIISTLFFPFVNVEYVDIGGEPVGFDTLFATWLQGQSLEALFESASGER
jgi:hypothetical protein